MMVWLERYFIRGVISGITWSLTHITQRHAVNLILPLYLPTAKHWLWKLMHDLCHTRGVGTEDQKRKERISMNHYFIFFCYQMCKYVNKSILLTWDTNSQSAQDVRFCVELSHTWSGPVLKLCWVGGGVGGGYIPPISSFAKKCLSVPRWAITRYNPCVPPASAPCVEWARKEIP